MAGGLFAADPRGNERRRGGRAQHGVKYKTEFLGNSADWVLYVEPPSPSKTAKKKYVAYLTRISQKNPAHDPAKTIATKHKNRNYFGLGDLSGSVFDVVINSASHLRAIAARGQT